jgi:hypothetical protein
MCDQMNKIVTQIETNLVHHGFRRVDLKRETIPDGIMLLKRQNLNTNRAAIILEANIPPTDLHSYLMSVRNAVAKQVKFFPFFWGVGIQVVLICPGILPMVSNPESYVAKVDNQWAIIQSVYFVDPSIKEFVSGRTWGQYITGKFQNSIMEAIASVYNRNCA